MNRYLAALACAAVLLSVFGQENPYDYVEYDYEHWSFSTQATLVLPQGGAKLHRLGGATVRVGYYVDDAWMLEGSASWLEDAAGLGVHGLWHWWLYEPFDPFFTIGADGWIDGGVGPSLGWGCFWHFDDNWSLRADANATLDIDGTNEMIYTFALGLQYAF